MSTPTPEPYRVSVSRRVRETLLKLSRDAFARGDGQAFVKALREFNRRLTVYPQFGDPLIDLVHEPGQVRIGIVPPLAMRYAVLEERRQVFLATIPVLLPKSPLPG